MAPGHPGEEAGSDHSPGPSSFLAPCRPPGPAALKIRPGLITLTPICGMPFAELRQ